MLARVLNASDVRDYRLRAISVNSFVAPTSDRRQRRGYTNKLKVRHSSHNAAFFTLAEGPRLVSKIAEPHMHANFSHYASRCLVL